MRYAELAARGAGASARLVPRRRRLSAPGAAHNWCENIKFSHKHWATPETLQELQAAVVAAASVRVLGSGHSFSAVCDSEDTLVSLAFMRDVLGVTVVDEDAMFVSVEGGATLGDVVRHLAPRGFALKNIPSLPHVTVAGALATATHGTGLRPGLEGGMPSACREIEFVTADGSLARYARGDAAFGASVVHLGALGVVSRVALDVVPSYEVEQRVYEEVDLDLFLPRFEEVARAVDSLTVGINFGQQAALLWMRYFDRPDGRGTPPPPPADALLGGRLRAAAIPFYESAGEVRGTRRGAWHDVPSFFMEGMRETNMPNVAMQSEYFVPLGRASEALHAVRRVASAWPGWPASEARAELHAGVPVFHCEVRAIAADGLAGACPFGDRDSVSIHFTWGGWEHRERILQMVAELEAALRPFGPRPHFGKLNTLRADEIGAAYGGARLDAFRERCAAHDPRGKFRNPLLRSQIWGEGEFGY
jgi:xylitol oxidase